MGPVNCTLIDLCKRKIPSYCDRDMTQHVYSFQTNSESGLRILIIECEYRERLKERGYKGYFERICREFFERL